MKRTLSGIMFAAVLIVLAVAPTSVSAVESWFPIVPCGLNAQPAGIDKSVHDYTQPCNQCLLLELGENLIDLTIVGIVPMVGTLFFLWAGFTILWGGRNGDPGAVTRGKSLMWNTAIGIAILLSAWLITNFVLKTIAANDDMSKDWYKLDCRTGTLKDIVEGTPTPSKSATPSATPAQRYSCNNGNQCVSDPKGQYTTNTCDSKCQAPPGGALAISTGSLANAIEDKPYAQSLSATGGTGPYTWSVSGGSLPDGLTLSAAGQISGTPTKIGSFAFTIRAQDASNPKQSTTKQFDIKVNVVTGVVCSPWPGADPNRSLCLAEKPNNSCGSGVAACAQYASSVAKYASQFSVSANFLKSIMVNESSCRANADSGHAYGLMQIQPATANQYRQYCGVSVTIDAAWLKSHPEQSICLAAAYFNSLNKGTCGSNPQNLAAGYNGGPKACQASSSCSGERSCLNEQTRKWQCLYNDTQHTKCNTGYSETRLYAARVLYCNNNPGF